MSEGKLREEKARAENAERLLNDPLLSEAFEHLDTEFMRTWRQTSVADTEARERIYNLCQSLDTLRGFLTAVVENGKLAKAQLEQLKK